VTLFTENAKVLFKLLAQSDQLYTPEFCILECANVLWKQVRFHNMPQAAAESLLDDLIALPLIVLPAAGLLKRGLQIGLAHQLAVYDAVYIALAERLGYPLITTDARQSAAAQALGVTLKPVTDFTL
jgi:predicted nucleic acid-binding protein